MIHSLNRILVVIDPTRRQQWALRKAIMIAKIRPGVEVLAYLAVYSRTKAKNTDELREVELIRQAAWLDDLLAEEGDSSVKLVPIVEWRKDWVEGAITAVRKWKADIMLKHASGKPRSLDSSDRQLIRGIPTAVMLINSEPQEKLGTLLVALDLNAESSRHRDLNEHLLELANRILGVQAEAELHVVNAFPDSEHFVHATDLARKAGIDRKRAHAILGKPVQVIEETASNIAAELVMIGTVGRRGLSGIYIGNTAEKILGDLDCDVLILGAPA